MKSEMDDNNTTPTLKAKILKRIQVRGSRVRLHNYPSDWTLHPDLKEREGEDTKQYAKKILEQNIEELSTAEGLLYASGRAALLIVFQGMDTSGKDGTIKHVMSGLNPQSCRVTGFKQPSREELARDFLWRYSKALPERGEIGIFNRSHYEEVLVTRVHPEWLEKQGVPPDEIGKQLWQDRYRDINAWEHHLSRSGTMILKFFLHISKAEQKRRLLERLDDPKKNWKFSAGDLAERKRWNDYVEAYEDALTATSTRWAPWHIIPADHKWSARVLIAQVITDRIRLLKLKYPKMSAAQAAELRKAKAALKS
jgi:PPK2 family polyphosphate:nucleotide phosphotransferase